MFGKDQSNDYRHLRRNHEDLLNHLVDAIKSSKLTDMSDILKFLENEIKKFAEENCKNQLPKFVNSSKCQKSLVDNKKFDSVDYSAAIVGCSIECAVPVNVLATSFFLNKLIGGSFF